MLSCEGQSKFCHTRKISKGVLEGGREAEYVKAKRHERVCVFGKL